jgi:transposase
VDAAASLWAQNSVSQIRALMPHRDFLETARIEKSDITLQALCDRLSAERGVKADTSMMSRFFRRIGVTVKKRPSSRASRIAPI